MANITELLLWDGFQLRCPVCGWYRWQIPPPGPVDKPDHVICLRCGLKVDVIPNENSITFEIKANQYNLKDPWNKRTHYVPDFENRTWKKV